MNRVGSAWSRLRLYGHYDVIFFNPISLLEKLSHLWKGYVSGGKSVISGLCIYIIKAENQEHYYLDDENEYGTTLI